MGGGGRWVGKEGGWGRKVGGEGRWVGEEGGWGRKVGGREGGWGRKVGGVKRKEIMKRLLEER